MSRVVVRDPPPRLFALAAAACLAALLVDVWAHRRLGVAAAALTTTRQDTTAATVRRDATDRVYHGDLERAAALQQTVQDWTAHLAGTALFKDGLEAGRAFVKAHPEAQPLIDEAWTDLANSWPRASARAAGFSPQQIQAYVALFQRQKGVLPYSFVGIELRASNGGDLGPEAQQSMLRDLVGDDLYARYQNVLRDESGSRAAQVYAAAADAGVPLTFEQILALRQALEAGQGSGRKPWDNATRAAATILSAAQMEAFNAVKETYAR